MKKVVSGLGGAFALAMFLLAIYVMRRELEGYTFSDVLAAAQSVSLVRLALAALLTVVCYLALTGYDLLAARKQWGTLRPLSVMLNSFICHAMSINVGFSSLTGGTIRCQYYLHKGLPAIEVMRIVTFCMLTFWLGFLALGGVILVVAPPAIPPFIPVPFSSLQPVGSLFLVAVTAYLLLGILRSEPLTIRRWVIPAIPPHISFAQMLVAMSEWLLGAAVLWLLLPAHPDFSYFHLLSYYLLAQVSGLFSQVPSGLGVFESIVLALSPADIPPSTIVGGLLLYRLLFNLFPLTVAGLALLAREVKRRAGE